MAYFWSPILLAVDSIKLIVACSFLYRFWFPFLFLLNMKRPLDDSAYLAADSSLSLRSGDLEFKKGLSFSIIFRLGGLQLLGRDSSQLGYFYGLILPFSLGFFSGISTFSNFLLSFFPSDLTFYLLNRYKFKFSPLRVWVYWSRVSHIWVLEGSSTYLKTAQLRESADLADSPEEEILT